MTTRHYDALVIGGRLSACITAALMAKRGMRGLLIDQGELSSLDGKLLPDVVLSEQGSLAMELVHSELGVREDLKVRCQSVTPTFQAIFSDQRVDISLRRDETQRDLRRAFGPTAASFSRLFAELDEAEGRAGQFLATAGELPPSGFFGKRAASQIAKRHSDLLQTIEQSGIFKDAPTELQEIALAPLPFLTHIDGKRASDVPLARFVRPVGRFFRGISHLDEGKSLRELFLDVAKRKGFEIKRSAVETVETKGKSLSVRVAGSRDDLITADVLVDCSADLSGLDTIPHKQQSKELALMLQAAKPRGFLHALAIEVDRAVIPPGMAEYVILLNGRRDPSRFEDDPDAEDRPILVNSRILAATPSRTLLIAVHPVSSVRAHSQRMEQLDEAIRARVERLIPFLSEGAPVMHTLSGRGGKEARPFLAHPLFEPDLDPLAGITGISMRTTFNNVFVAGPAVMPGLGIEGEYFSALQAADACEALGKGVKRPKTLAQRAPVSPTSA
jgi:glycine/D-amino acid oxidase-like deaminating enzyme